jgi:peptide/nickel transport system substrate-binding protein
VVVALVVAVVTSLVTVAAAQDRTKSKEIVVGLGAEPRTMLGVMIVDWTTNNMLEHIYDRLLDRDSKTFKAKPMLAESWRIVNDTTWEFKLRKGVKFHNGDPLTAEDVKFSVERVTEPGKEKKKSPQYGNIRAIKDVRIVDAETIQLVTDKPFPLLLERLVFFPIVPKKHIEKVGDDAFGTTAASRPTWSPR